MYYVSTVDCHLHHRRNLFPNGERKKWRNAKTTKTLSLNIFLKTKFININIASKLRFHMHNAASESVCDIVVAYATLWYPCPWTPLSPSDQFFKACLDT